VHLAVLLRAAGKTQEAEPTFRQAVAIYEKQVADAITINNIAWSLATNLDLRLRHAAWAVELATLATGRAPDNPLIVNTLGTAYYRAGNWKAALETLKNAAELHQGRHFGHDAFFISMACWQQGDKDAARKWYTAAARWMERNEPNNEDLRRYRTEAGALLGI